MFPRELPKLLRKDEQPEFDRSRSSLTEASTPESKKRKVVGAACLQCRRRKSKCDGNSPCATCLSVHGTDCQFDPNSDPRRKDVPKGDNEKWKTIFDRLRDSPAGEAADILHRIRTHEDPDRIAERATIGATLPKRGDWQWADGDLAHPVESPYWDAAGKHFGYTSGLDLARNEEHSPLQIRPFRIWTTVTMDHDLVSELLDLYFCWSHPYYTFFQREFFTHDMARNIGEHCSPLLVNAVLALACSWSDRPELRSKASDPKTAGDHFFAEARRLLYLDESSNLTTVQALAIMALREGSCNRDSTSFEYAGRSMTMAKELGLHLSSGNAIQRFGDIELEARKVTFWGCFAHDTALSICVGRISQLPREAITLEFPSIRSEEDKTEWVPSHSPGAIVVTGAAQPSHSDTLQHYFSLLSGIVNDTVHMLYAPREKWTSKTLINLYWKYEQWYDSLPKSLELRGVSTPTPQLLLLHMYYHTVIIHLFRPFINRALLGSSISPRDVCTSCSDKISDLVRTYRVTYTLRRSTVLLAHVILTSSIVDLLNLPSRRAALNLEQGLKSLQEACENHAFAERSLDIILELAKQWNISLPSGVSLATYGF